MVIIEKLHIFWTFSGQLWVKITQNETWEHAFLCTSIPFCDFLSTGIQKVEPNLFRLFPFFLLFLSSAAVVNFLLGSLLVQEFSRKHHPNGKFLPRDKRTCRHIIQMRKICCNSSCYWEKNRKKCITLWHWAVIECNANNYSTGWNFGRHVFIAIVYRSWFHNNHHVLTHFPILESSWSACVSADDLVNDCFESCQSICQILFRRVYQLTCSCLFSLYCEITILSIIICKICLE